MMSNQDMARNEGHGGGRRFLLNGAAAAIMLATTAGSLHAAAGSANSYPTKPVRMLLPLAAGGGMDIIARGVAQKLTESLGQSVVVDNRPSAGGSVAIELTSRAAPDGHTIMMMSASSVTHGIIYQPRFDLLKDLAPVSQVTAQPYVIVVNPSVPVSTPQEFVNYAKANPRKLNYASSGNGGLIHLAAELLDSMTGAKLTHIPYKGLGAAYPDIFGGQVHMTIASTISAIPHIKSGKLRAIAMTGKSRSRTLPDVPTLAEGAVPGFEVTQWYGVLAPAKTPMTVMARIQKDIAALLQQPEMMQRMASEGSEPIGSTPAAFTAHIRTETEKWTKVVKQAGIKGD